MSKDIAIKGASTYVLPVPADQIRDVIRENLGGAGLSRFDLERVKMPSGGATVFMVPGLEGEKPETALEGVIVSMKHTRVYWRAGLDQSGGGTPPDCSSDDGVSGRGERYPGDEPGAHACDSCKLAEFGSATKGSGQACKQVQLLFLKRPGEMLPYVVALPPTSLATAKKYLLRLLSSGIKITEAVTRISLVKKQSAGGQAYAQAEFTFVRRLNEEEAPAIAAYASAIRPVLDGVRASREDASAAEGRPASTGFGDPA